MFLHAVSCHEIQLLLNYLGYFIYFYQITETNLRKSLHINSLLIFTENASFSEICGAICGVNTAGSLTFKLKNLLFKLIRIYHAQIIPGLGDMLKKMTTIRSTSFERENRIVDGHKITVRYIASLVS